MTRKPTTLAERLRWLIAQSHEGRVKRAAVEMGLHQPSLSRLVNGRVQNPHMTTLEPIADYYGISMDWLLTGKGEEPTVVSWQARMEEAPRPGDYVTRLPKKHPPVAQVRHTIGRLPAINAWVVQPEGDGVWLAVQADGPKWKEVPWPG